MLSLFVIRAFKRAFPYTPLAMRSFMAEKEKGVDIRIGDEYHHIYMNISSTIFPSLPFSAFLQIIFLF